MAKTVDEHRVAFPARSQKASQLVSKRIQKAPPKAQEAMRYVAFLRGINVGGNNTVHMARLATMFTSLGCTDVLTYINSGNVVFQTKEHNAEALTATIESALCSTFSLSIRIVLRDALNIAHLCKGIPEKWSNNADQKTDILFLWNEIDTPQSITQIQTNPAVDSLLYFPGAIVWHIKREHSNTSGMRKFIGTKIYRNMTARNVNTVRKVNELLGNT